jgi:antitoxin ParD1/3/4
MPTRNVVLTDHQAALVERLVESGRYQNASEVLREGLRLVEDRERFEKAREKALREAAQVGVADLDSGRYATYQSGAELERRVAEILDEAVTRHGKPAVKR